MSNFKLPLYIHYVGGDSSGGENYEDAVARVGDLSTDAVALSIPMDHPACLRILISFHEANPGFGEFVTNNNLKYNHSVELWHRDHVYKQWAIILFVEFESETDLIVFKMRE